MESLNNNKSLPTLTIIKTDQEIIVRGRGKYDTDEGTSLGMLITALSGVAREIIKNHPKECLDINGCGMIAVSKMVVQSINDIEMYSAGQLRLKTNSNVGKKEHKKK